MYLQHLFYSITLSSWTTFCLLIAVLCYLQHQFYSITLSSWTPFCLLIPALCYLWHQFYSITLSLWTPQYWFGRALSTLLPISILLLSMHVLIYSKFCSSSNYMIRNNTCWESNKQMIKWCCDLQSVCVDVHIYNQLWPVTITTLHWEDDTKHQVVFPPGLTPTPTSTTMISMVEKCDQTFNIDGYRTRELQAMVYAQVKRWWPRRSMLYNALKLDVKQAW